MASYMIRLAGIDTDHTEVIEATRLETDRAGNLTLYGEGFEVVAFVSQSAVRMVHRMDSPAPSPPPAGTTPARARKTTARKAR